MNQMWTPGQNVGGLSKTGVGPQPFMNAMNPYAMSGLGANGLQSILQKFLQMPPQGAQKQVPPAFGLRAMGGIPGQQRPQQAAAGPQIPRAPGPQQRMQPPLPPQLPRINPRSFSFGVGGQAAPMNPYANAGPDR